MSAVREALARLVGALEALSEKLGRTVAEPARQMLPRTGTRRKRASYAWELGSDVLPGSGLGGEAPGGPARVHVVSYSWVCRHMPRSGTALR